jgi:hypothetical protein
MRLSPGALPKTPGFLFLASRMVIKRTARNKAVPPDEATVLIREAIRAHVPAAIAELARLALDATSETARVAAINALIDRGYGKLKDVTDGDDGAHAITVRFVAPAEPP